jgi:predicted transcriptional regulator
MTNVVGLMVPLSEYASVREDETLEEALKALHTAQKKLPRGRQPHRAILVRDSGDNIVGKIGHFVILDALLPWSEGEFRAPAFQQAWVSDELVQQTLQNLALLHQHLSDICQRARSIRVGDLAARETISIEHDVPLVAAVRLLVEHQALSLLVRYDGRPVGVLRIADVFDYLSDYILKCDDADAAGPDKPDDDGADAEPGA